MASIIAVAQQKGGAGKTTVAAHLAAAFAVSARVAILDIDPQKSLARWHKLRAGRAVPPITLIDVSGWRLAAALDAARKTHDVILIDSPPQIGTDARLAIRSADLVLVPLQPSPPDLWAAEGTFALAAEEKRRLALVLNRSPAKSRLRSAVESEIAALDLPLLAATLGNRAGYANAFAQGLGVAEAAPRSLAGQELMALKAEIAALL